MWDKKRNLIFIALICCLATLSLTVYLQWHRSKSKFSVALCRELAREAKPLIDAIELFKAKNNRLPEDVEELINSGIAKKEVLISKKNAVDWHYEKHGNSYEIGASIGVWVNSESFYLYWPEKSYPESLESNIANIFFRRFEGWYFIAPKNGADIRNTKEIHLAYLQN